MNETEIKRRCEVRTWTYNVVSAYLVETGITPYRLSQVMGVNRSVVQLWIHSDNLSGAVQFLFLYLRKRYLQDGYKVTDEF